MLAVWIFTGGWAASAVSMIWFFYLEGFPLNWWQAYGEPLLPTLAMGVLLLIGGFTGALFALFIALALISLILLSLYIEGKPGKGAGPLQFNRDARSE